MELEGDKEKYHFLHSMLGFVRLHLYDVDFCVFKDKKFSVTFRHQSSSLFAGESASFVERTGVENPLLRAEQCRESPGVSQAGGVWAEPRDDARLVSVRFIGPMSVVRGHGAIILGQEALLAAFPRAWRAGCRMALGVFLGISALPP